MSKLELSPRQKKNLDILIQRAKDMALTPAQTELVARLSMVESALNTQTGHSNTFNGEFQIRGARWTDLLGKLNPYIIAHKETFAMLAIKPFSKDDRLNSDRQRDAVLLYVKKYCASDIDLTPVKDIGSGPFKQFEKYLTWNRFYAWWNTDPKQINRVNEIIMGKDPQRPLSNIYEDIHNQVNLKPISWFDGTVNYAQNDLVGTDAVYTSGTDETVKDIKPDIYLRDYSISELDEMIKNDQTDAWLFYGRALEYFIAGRSDLALLDYNKAAKLDPYGAGSFYDRVLKNFILGNHDLVIGEFDEMITLNPLDERLFYGRGLAYSFANNHDLALRDFGEAIKLNHEYAEAYYGCASAKFFLGDDGRPDYEKYKFYNTKCLLLTGHYKDDLPVDFSNWQFGEQDESFSKIIDDIATKYGVNGQFPSSQVDPSLVIDNNQEFQVNWNWLDRYYHYFQVTPNPVPDNNQGFQVNWNWLERHYHYSQVNPSLVPDTNQGFQVNSNWKFGEKHESFNKIIEEVMAKYGGNGQFPPSQVDPSLVPDANKGFQVNSNWKFGEKHESFNKIIEEVMTKYGGNGQFPPSQVNPNPVLDNNPRLQANPNPVPNHNPGLQVNRNGLEQNHNYFQGNPNLVPNHNQGFQVNRNGLEQNHNYFQVNPNLVPNHNPGFQGLGF